jgi:hypothetical protein
MKKIVIACGLIAGFISIIWVVTSMVLQMKNHDFDNGMIWGYAGMILAFSLIFVGIKKYWDSQGGVVSFGKAFRIGFFITLIASTVYVVVWLIDLYFFMPDFADQYATYKIDKMKASGATQVAINAEIAEMNTFKDLYKNPLFVILFTYLEILPVGLLLSLIAALVLKRKNGAGTQVQHA